MVRFNCDDIFQREKASQTTWKQTCCCKTHRGHWEMEDGELCELIASKCLQKNQSRTLRWQCKLYWKKPSNYSKASVTLQIHHRIKTQSPHSIIPLPNLYQNPRHYVRIHIHSEVRKKSFRLCLCWLRSWTHYNWSTTGQRLLLPCWYSALQKHWSAITL